MNEFSAKKLGEVLAFARVGVETIDKAQSALNEAFGEEATVRLREERSAFAEKIVATAQDKNILDAVEMKAEATGEKLRSMRDMYIGDEWDNAAEILEWSGFFEGAALVHWSLVRGVADENASEELNNLAAEGHNHHRDTLELVEETIMSIGADRASA